MLKMENMDQIDSWVVAVKSSLEGETRADKSDDGLIHTVPKSLLCKNTEVFYIPQVISFGPYHFKRMYALDHDMELLKSEVARKVHRKIKRDDGLRLVVKKFEEKEIQEKIKESYAKEFTLPSEACAWMIVRDACFLLEVLDRFQKDEDAENSGSASIDSTLSRKRHHPLLTEIVKDMLKMENQLPFWALDKIRLYIGELSDGDTMSDIDEESTDDVWFESALKKLSPIEVAEVRNRQYKKESHILQLLHDYIVGRQVSPSSIPVPDVPTSSMMHIFIEKIHFCFFDILVGTLYGVRSLFRTTWSPIRLSRLFRLFRLLVNALIILLLSPLFVLSLIWVTLFAIWYYTQSYISPEEEELGGHVPTVEELKRVGVKFKKLEGIGISHIKFKESDSTLYLPKFEVDNRSEVILRNLIAMEICSQGEQKPITRYTILMNDLINTSGDVGILRQKGIITSKLGSDDEIAQLWNSMATSTEMPRYEPIDVISSSINTYRKKWWKVLWAQFIMVHCSKPWLFLSLLGGLLLLGLTFVQVICLFASCQPK